jgi:hypothetical protein
MAKPKTFGQAIEIVAWQLLLVRQRGYSNLEGGQPFFDSAFLYVASEVTKMTFRNSWLAFALVVALVASFLLVSGASASVTGTVLTGSSGTMTFSLNSAIFNFDPAATGGGNSDVATGTVLTFAGCSGVLGSPGCLSAQEGVTINNADLTLTVPSAANASTFLTFAAHPNLVYSINWPPGPGSANTNCATANSNGLSCSIFAGSPLVLTYDNGDTFIGLGVTGKASDTGVGGLPTGSPYLGGFSEFLTAKLPDGMAPTPLNIQLYLCPTGICQPADFTSGKSITSSQSGSFTALLPPAVPEPSSVSLSLLGTILLLLGTTLHKLCGVRA